MSSSGFLSGTRENKVDSDKFERLSFAVKRLCELTKADRQISKLAVACLNEVPWQMENTIPHYKSVNPNAAKEINKMAERLREEIQDLLWSGLEEYYKNVK